MIDEVILKTDAGVRQDAVEAQRAPQPSAAQKKSDQRRRAKRTMIIVTVVCLALGLAPTAEQLIRHGWHSFVDRAPGVGGTPSAPETEPVPAANVPSAPVPPKASHRRSAPTARPQPSRSLRSVSRGSTKQPLNVRFVAAVKP